jgi:hypothetical protein
VVHKIFPESCSKSVEKPQKQVLENWQKTSIQQLVNTSAFTPFEIASMKVVTKEERQEKSLYQRTKQEKKVRIRTRLCEQAYRLLENSFIH